MVECTTRESSGPPTHGLGRSSSRGAIAAHHPVATSQETDFRSPAAADGAAAYAVNGLPSLIAFIGKGGSGKSTLMLSAAVALIENGTSVVIADLDPANGSTARWPELRRHTLENGRTDLVDVTVVAQTHGEVAIDTLDRAKPSQ